MSRRKRFDEVRCISLICLVAFLVSIPSASAEQPQEVGKEDGTLKTTSISKESTGPGCRRCHYCDRPTPKNKCLLHPCLRNEMAGRGVGLPDDRGPDVVILDELEGVYLPVPFDHKGHADMADMAGGCTVCHHFTPEGEKHPACKSCHDVSAAGTDIHKPGLKGAYHQQCLNCHRDWIDETDCAKCHARKAGGSNSGDSDWAPTKDVLLGQMHPPIPEPETDFYTGGTGRTSDTLVVFRHKEHVHQFGLNCVECHHEPSCTRCHTRAGEQDRQLTLVEHHKPCLQCHKRDMDGSNSSAECDRCHWQEGKPKPKRFDHAATGWPLNKFHQDISCRNCHPGVPFVKLNNDCNACHSGWNPSVFDHSVTGQALDENHAEQDCEMCHAERKFDRPPTCSECHDEDDGITFPAKRPGPPPVD